MNKIYTELVRELTGDAKKLLDLSVESVNGKMTDSICTLVDEYGVGPVGKALNLGADEMKGYLTIQAPDMIMGLRYIIEEYDLVKSKELVMNLPPNSYGGYKKIRL